MSEALYTEKQLELMSEQMALIKGMREELERFKNDPVGTAPTASVFHGLNPAGTLGLYGRPGVDPRMYSTIVSANGSFSRTLRALATVFLQHRREIVTGITAGTGEAPEGVCDDGARPGNLKVCAQDFEFGKFKIRTDTVAGPEVGSYYTLADQDRRVIPADGVGRGPFTPDVLNAVGNTNSITYKQFKQMAHALELAWESVIIRGSPTSPTTFAQANLYWYQQFAGLDSLITNGYTDAVSGAACPAVDSDVRSFGNTDIGGESPDGSFVDVVTDQYNGLMMSLGRESGMGYDPNTSAWAYLVHPWAWNAIARSWPCNYLTVGCGGLVAANGQSLNIDAERQRRMQDEMYQGKFLLIDGERVPVLFSWGVPIQNVGPDTWNTTAYLVPMVLNGEMPLYLEYFNMGNQQQVEWHNLTGPNDDTRVLNNGMYRMYRFQKTCIEYELNATARLLLEAPFAAGRIDGIQFTTRMRSRNPVIGESYHLNGGQTSRGTYSY